MSSFKPHNNKKNHNIPSSPSKSPWQSPSNPMKNPMNQRKNIKNPMKSHEPNTLSNPIKKTTFQCHKLTISRRPASLLATPLPFLLRPRGRWNGRLGEVERIAAESTPSNFEGCIMGTLHWAICVYIYIIIIYIYIIIIYIYNNHM